MSKGWDYRSGDWNIICDVCSKKVKASTTKERWDGFRVCTGCFETRQPLDFIKARLDKISVDFTRAQQTDQFIVLNLTQYPTDQVGLTDEVQTSAEYYRYVGRITYPEDADLVNGSFINLLAINSNSNDPASPTNEESFLLTESITYSYGFNVSLSDTVTLSESISEGEGEFPEDSFSFTETITYLSTTNKLINAHTLNEVTLG